MESSYEYIMCSMYIHLHACCISIAVNECKSYTHNIHIYIFIYAYSSLITFVGGFMNSHHGAFTTDGPLVEGVSLAMTVCLSHVF